MEVCYQSEADRSGGTWECKCNLCKNDKTFKGSYTRVKAHILHEKIKGIDVCAHARNPKVKAKFKKENDDAQRLKDQRSKIGTGTTNHRMTDSIEPRIVQEARKRRALEVEEDLSKPSNPIKDSRLLKMLERQGGEEVDSRVARTIFVCGIPFNVVRSPYWQHLVRAINKAPQGYKGPNYEKVGTVLLKKERQVLGDILKPIRNSWFSTEFSIISDGWTDTRRKPLINVIASSLKEAMFIKEEDCLGEVKDGKFIVEILISAIEQAGPQKVVQVTQIMHLFAKL